MPCLNKQINLLCLLALLWMSPASAGDGVIEINQACAINGGCFPGDTAGFPVIDGNNLSSNNYILTSDLHVAGVDTTGIFLGDSSTLDLNGFTIYGPISCEGMGDDLVCDQTGLGMGVFGSNNTTVKNGTIVGFGQRGIALFSGRVKHVSVKHINGIGIRVGGKTSGSLVSNCIADANDSGMYVVNGIVINSHANGNRTNGFRVESGGSLQGSTSMNNGGDGVNVGLGTSESETTLVTVSDNTSTNNGGVGIIGGNGVHIRNNLVSENTGNGIQVSKGGLIQGNTVYKNGENGILASSSNLVIDNAMRENAGFGLYFVGSQSNYHGNMMSVNTAGSVGGTGTALNSGLNTCGNSTACP